MPITLDVNQLTPDVIWASPSVKARVADRIPGALHPPFSTLPPGTRSLLAVGGGGFLDEAKHWRMQKAPECRLTLIPSLWGSGAEVSPVVVRTVNGQKEIQVDDAFLPDAIAYWPELAESVPAQIRRYGCGDVWAHALEAFFSPLAGNGLLADLAGLLRRLAAQPTLDAALWFELSANACALQSQAGVGLIHGIAHVLEPVLHASHPLDGWGHARLCATLLAPVFDFNLAHSEKPAQRFRDHQVDSSPIQAATRALFSESDYQAIVPLIQTHWMDILRDRCTRMNGVLVKRAHLEFFSNWILPTP